MTVTHSALEAPHQECMIAHAIVDVADQDVQDHAEVMAASGFHIVGLAKAAYAPESALAFVEVHIEQGPMLISEDVPVGIVTAIPGASRFMVEIEGLAGHAGTVPMDMRRDAVMAAVEIGLYIERRCSGTLGLVGTVGQFNVPDGAANVVPGKACAKENGPQSGPSKAVM